MRFLLRADAGIETGTGHVMRCLTLAEELLFRGHKVVLRGTLGGVQWLHEQVVAVGLPYEEESHGALDAQRTGREAWDAVVVDSYLIDPLEIRRLNEMTPVMAVIDGDDRGITATRYLDQNLGAENQQHGDAVANSLLAGSRYCLVRRAVRDLRRDDRWRLPRNPSVLAFMGGSDPLGAMQQVATSLRDLPGQVGLTLVTPSTWDLAVRAIVEDRPSTLVVAPTASFPSLLAHADIIVSATGTSAWDICTMGIPAVFAAVVDNQQAGLQAITDSGVALGIDASENLRKLHGLRGLVELLLRDEHIRKERAEKSLEVFDGRGASRVADELERLN